MGERRKESNLMLHRILRLRCVNGSTDDMKQKLKAVAQNGFPIAHRLG